MFVHEKLQMRKRRLLDSKATKVKDSRTRNVSKASPLCLFPEGKAGRFAYIPSEDVENESDDRP
jgi:hypothetical protein